jgi:PAS domain S-box-containing protein
VVRQDSQRAASDSFFDMSLDMLGTVGADGFFKRVNPAWQKSLGWAPEELMARSWLHLVHPDDRAASAESLASVVGDTAFENRYLGKDGEYRDLQWNAAADSHDRVSVVVRDITHQKLWTKRLLFTDRLVSLGTLAAGVAHEINNPLAFITVNLDVILEDLCEILEVSPSARLREIQDLANDAREGTERLRKIVRGLKVFSRAEPPEKTPMDARSAIELSINMAFAEIRHRARLVKDFGPIPPVDADETRLGQVFVNLLVNAAQAIAGGFPERNEIRVSTRTDALGRAVIEVADTGVGIAPATLPRVFDPFFTTKPAGMGTGLGLSICRQIVTDLGGEIGLESQVGVGTTFRVVLPPASSDVGRRDEVEAIAEPECPSRVLVIDDDELVGLSLRRILRGYEVIVVTDARDALDRLRIPGNFDLILCDLMMPGMTGMDLYAELARTSPAELEGLVFMTGRLLDESVRKFLDEVGNERIEKPFGAHQMRALVKRLVRLTMRPPA